ncbi:MAG: nitrilase family protein [Brumimicrobium sp.]|nr:nitrilase family protein [Brumimicrobium sp.]MCO5267383.1 nitrilase family protein [Brumimicrobium sp.]
MQDLRVTLVQCHQIWENKTANLSHFSKLLEEAQPVTDILIFPEMFQTGFSMNASSLAESMNGESILWLTEMAQKYNTAVVASLIITENNCFYNRMVFVEPDGTITSYNKRKLFGLASEEKTYTPGEEEVILVYKGWNIRLQVCYDLRFPEIQRNKVTDGKYDYDLMINVANWPEKRSLHWKTLLRARAIENQCYHVGVNRVGDGNGLKYSGDSAVINPLGEALVDIFQNEKVETVLLSKNLLAEVRERMPFLKDR